jgi:hypothetical protein
MIMLSVRRLAGMASPTYHLYGHKSGKRAALSVA